jgi:hypothetical protein
VGAVLVHKVVETTNSKTSAPWAPASAGSRPGGVGGHQTHCWALRQQARRFFAPLVGEPEAVPSFPGDWVGPRDRVGVLLPQVLVVGCGV